MEAKNLPHGRTLTTRGANPTRIPFAPRASVFPTSLVYAPSVRQTDRQTEIYRQKDSQRHTEKLGQTDRVLLWAWLVEWWCTVPSVADSTPPLVVTYGLWAKSFTRNCLYDVLWSLPDFSVLLSNRNHNRKFLHRPPKRSRGNQLIHRGLTRTKLIGSGSRSGLCFHIGSNLGWK